MIEFKKIKLIQAIIFLSTIVGLALQFYQNRKIQQDNDRLNWNLLNIQSSLTEFTTSDNKTAKQGSVLELKLSELGKLYPNILLEIKNLKLKPNKVVSFSQSELGSHLDVTTLVRDSVVFDTLQTRVFDYSDAYYSIHGILTGTTQKLSISYHDTLTQIVYKGRRNRPWLWFFSPRNLEQRISLKAPNSTVEFSKLIHIQKP